jgi:hypothetical protein
LLKFGQKGLVGTDSHLTYLLLPLQRGTESRKSRRKLILVTKDKNDQLKKVFGEDCSKEKGRMLLKFKRSHLCETSQKITKAERVKELVLMPMWLSGIKALPSINSYFLSGPST